jgi:transcriptional regulator with XRE-family HTH domain
MMARKAQRPTHGTKRPRPVDTAVGQKIRIYRLQARLSQTDLANGLGVTFQQVQKYEKGTNRVAPSRLSDIANMLHIPVAVLFPDDGQNTATPTLNPAELSIMTTTRGQRLATGYEQLPNDLRDLIVAVVEALASISPKKSTAS